MSNASVKVLFIFLQINSQVIPFLTANDFIDPSKTHQQGARRACHAAERHLRVHAWRQRATVGRAHRRAGRHAVRGRCLCAAHRVAGRVPVFRAQGVFYDADHAPEHRARRTARRTGGWRDLSRHFEWQVDALTNDYQGAAEHPAVAIVSVRQ